MRGALLNKAKRGELALPLPIGLVYNNEGQVVLDPDRQVQQSIRLLFATFRRTGTACATVRAFREQGVLFPRRPRGGLSKGQLHWVGLTHSHAIQILRSPRYAGAFVYGRTRRRRALDGAGRSTSIRQPREQWHTLLPNAHSGYISWEEYEENLRRLRENAQAQGAERRKSPPREGPALLQGLVLCGVCGKSMTVRYRTCGERLIPEYLCQQKAIACAEPPCQRIAGAGIDSAIGQLLMEAVTPVALEVTLAVQQEIQSRLREADRLRQARVERARYESNLAQRRYMQVDPENRLVADALEAEWNSKLRALEEAQRAYSRECQSDRAALSDVQQERILALAADFPRLWNNSSTPDRERKRMVRLMLEDVTLIKSDEITVNARFKGGAVRTLHLPIPPTAWQKFRTNPELVGQIDRLLESHTCQEIAEILNERHEYKPGKANRFNRAMINRIQRDYSLKSRYDRLRETGMLTQKEVAQILGVSTQTVCRRWRQGWLNRVPYNDKQEFLYGHPGQATPWRSSSPQHREAAKSRRTDNDRSCEVQCEA
jgi:DNA-binding transcriptional regulator YiaG